MSKTYRPYNADQQFLLQPSLREWLPDGHLAYFVSDTVDELDLSAIEAVYERCLRGSPPYHPRMMSKLLLYAYCTGVYSSRKIAQKLVDDVAFRILAGGCVPDFRTISDFRKDHLQALGGLFLQILALCENAGMVKLGHVALDGTKLRANASKHKAMSYSRMKDESARLSTEIAKLLECAQRVDEEEDQEYGKDVRGDELPKELAFREGRRAKIRQAMAELEAEAKAAAEAAGNGLEVDNSGEQKAPVKCGRPRKKLDGVPEDKAQRNFTDPESRIMKSADKSYIQGYNAQAAVDSEYQVIVAASVTAQASDSPHAVPVVESMEQNLGKLPEEMSLDAGYYSDGNVTYLEEKHVDVYLPPCRLKHSEYRTAVAEPVTQESPTRDRMKSKVLTEEGRKKYGLRKITVEPVFGQIKSCRGFRGFSMRGLKKCEAEWSLVCSAHNLLKLAKHRVVAMAQKAKQSTESVIIPRKLVCTV